MPGAALFLMRLRDRRDTSVTDWRHAINADVMFAHVHDNFGNMALVEISGLERYTATRETLADALLGRVARRRLVVAAHRYDGQAE